MLKATEIIKFEVSKKLNKLNYESPKEFWLIAAIVGVVVGGLGAIPGVTIAAGFIVTE